MALTVTLKKRSKLMNMLCNVFEVDFDSSYPTGGEALSLATLGIPNGATAVIAAPKAGYVFDYDETNEKLLAYSGGSQVGNGTDLSAVTGVKVFAYGR